ncbi:hypothetical protein KGV52_00205 [Candidatus Gracilibacteria bacterium]|nr:hypothetical protein [Candidatus Gracilibacteria bacterium]
MKKIFSIICLFFFSVHTSFANCGISGGEASSLSEYFSNTNKALQTLNQKVQQANSRSFYNTDNAVINKFTSEGKRIADAVVVAYNQAFDFEYFFSDFKFNLELPKKSEIPQEVKRDYNTIKKYQKTLQKYYEQLLKSGKTNVYIKNFCADLGNNIQCNIADNQTADDIMTLIIKNNTDIKHFFENVVAGNQTTQNYFEFVGTNFVEDMYTNYSPKGVESCNFKDNTLGASIRKRTGTIARLEQENRSAIQEWKDAWSLLTGATDSNEYRKLEKKLLQQELSRQGVSTDNQTTMLRNLDNFNQSGGFTSTNNPFSNTFSSLQQKIEKEVYIFKKETFSEFLQSKDEIQITNSLQIKDQAEEKIKIIEELQTLNAQLEKYSSDTNTTSQNLTSQLVNTHLELSQSINTLQESCKKAVEICNRQASGKGNCGSCE